jgi:Putative DNA-binding domain
LAIGLTNCQSEWVARSFENLNSDYGVLRRYLGELKFKHLINEYISAQLAKESNERWLSDHLPDFIAAYEIFMHFPEIAELALLERAQNRAFNADISKAVYNSTAHQKTKNSPFSFASHFHPKYHEYLVSAHM